LDPETARVLSALGDHGESAQNLEYLVDDHFQLADRLGVDGPFGEDDIPGEDELSREATDTARHRVYAKSRALARLAAAAERAAVRRSIPTTTTGSPWVVTPAIAGGATGQPPWLGQPRAAGTAMHDLAGAIMRGP
jgi:hypothetical protein